MIARISGLLLELDTEVGTALIEAGPLAYEVMIPAYLISDLSSQLGREIVLHCLEYYEGSSMGGNLIPRIVGFAHAEDKSFFRRFITVKGIGPRKALRALSRSLSDIAAFIENGDTKMLSTLPEIGKRTAEHIIAELKGKVTDFALAGGGAVVRATQKPLTGIEIEALEILLQLGERRNEAEELISRALDIFPDITTTDALIQAVYKVKAGAK